MAGVLKAQQGAGVPGAKDTRRHPPLHGHRKLEQPDGVRDDRPAAAEPVGQLVVRDPELGEQLLVRGRLLERVELDAVDVLEQGVTQHVVVAGPPDDRRDPPRARPAARPATAARP